MKVLMLNYEFPPLGGGAGNATNYLLQEFANYSACQIDLVTASVDRFKIEQFAGNITIHYLNIGKNNKDLHYQSNKDLIMYTWKSFLYARKLQAEKSFDLVHAFFGIPCGLVAMLLKRPYIVSLRGSDVPFYNRRFYWLDKLILKRLSRIVWSKAKKVVANSEGLKELALESSPGLEISVIYNGVDLDRFFPPEKKVSQGKLNLISTGRLIERKGYRYLIEALKDFNDVELTLIGEGNLSDELQLLAATNGVEVKFPGRIRHEELPSYLRKADVFVLPSLNEGMSNSVLEAMASGLPIVVTDTGGSRELIKGNGFVVEKASAQGLKNAINHYLQNKSLIIDHGLKSREVAEKLTWSEAAREYWNTFLKSKQE